MNTLQRIPRHIPICLRQFTTTSQCPRPLGGGAHAAFLDSMDPMKQAETPPPSPATSQNAGSELSRILRGTREITPRSDGTRERFSAPSRLKSDSQNKVMEELTRAGNERPILQQMPRRWKEGDIYSPHDLTIGEAKKWKRIMRRPEKDRFDMLGKNPLQFYKVLQPV